MQSNEKKPFHYTYSADRQQEVKRIRDKYIPRQADKMEQLVKLDRSVTQKAEVLSLVIGVLGSLILGLGMSCTLVWKEHLFIPGIIIGVIGLFAASLAYPIYLGKLKKEREKAAPEILRLTEELLK